MRATRGPMYRSGIVGWSSSCDVSPVLQSVLYRFCDRVPSRLSTTSAHRCRRKRALLFLYTRHWSLAVARGTALFFIYTCGAAFLYTCGAAFFLYTRRCFFLFTHDTAFYSYYTLTPRLHTALPFFNAALLFLYTGHASRLTRRCFFLTHDVCFFSLALHTSLLTAMLQTHAAHY